jgi:two-component sensor histidine kinase
VLLAVQMLAVATAYFLTAWVGLQLASLGDYVTLVWSPVGIALAAVVRLGPRVAPGIAVGAFAVTLTTAAPLPVALALAAGNTLGPLVAGLMLIRRLDFRAQLDRFQDVIAYVIVGVLGCSAITATAGSAALTALGVSPPATFPVAWATWFGGDAAGVLVVGTTLLTWSTRPALAPSQTRSGRELVGMLIVLIATTAIVLRYGLQVQSVAYGYFPLLLWAALRFGPRGASTATLIISTIVVCASAAGMGPFVELTAPHGAVSLWVFFSVTGISGLLLTAVLAERDRAVRHRERLMHELDHRVKNTLATVLAVAEQTGARAADVRAYIHTFTGRIRALARMHEALALANWEGIGLEEVVGMVMAPYATIGDGRALAEGDPTTLSPQVSGPIAMTLHELATNAAKHGAWSGTRGRVAVSWSADERGGVRLVWEESGGPLLDGQAQRGLGLRVIEGLVGYELDGDVTIEFRETGVVCTLRFPDSGLVETLGPH